MYLLTFGCAVSLLLCVLSLVVVSRGYSLATVHGLLICCGFSCCRVRALAGAGLSSCSVWPQCLGLLGSRAQAQ